MLADARQAGVLKFDGYEVHLAAGELRKNGVRVRLEIQPFQVLAMLLKRPGEVVTREEIQQALWADDTFVDFDNGLNTAVRKIRRALDDTPTDPNYVETLPKRGYRFVGSVSGFAQPRPRAPYFTTRTPWIGVAASLTLALAYLLWPLPRADILTFTERSLTYSPGRESHASFSPDGTRVAYHWDGGVPGSSDIYIKLVESGAGEPVRVTSDPREDLAPAWSPDGSKIVFARFVDHRSTHGDVSRGVGRRFQLVLVDPVADSREQVLGDFETRARQTSQGWSPDSKYIAFSCRIDAPAGLWQLCLYSLDTRNAWPLTSPSGNVGDAEPKFSPDGRSVLYLGSGRLYLLELSEDMRPNGEPKAIAGPFRYGKPAGWSPDGRLAYFIGSSPKGEHGLWVVEPTPGSEPRLLHTTKLTNLTGPTPPALWWGPSGEMRVAFDAPERDSQIMRVDLSGEPPLSPAPLTDANGQDLNPSFSPDGSRIAFISNRTGTWGIWTCDPDGSNQKKLIELGRFAGFSIPEWSPKGDRIAVDAIFKTGDRDAYIVDVAAATASQAMTQGGGRLPAWSRDEQSIYYTRGNARSIWKLDGASGKTELFLPEYGSGPFTESHDSSALYFIHGSNLMRVALDEQGRAVGEPETLAERVVAFALAKSDRVYFMDESGSIRLKAGERAERTVIVEAGLQSSPLQSHISVSPDERWLLYTQHKLARYDLKLLESVK